MNAPVQYHSRRLQRPMLAILAAVLTAAVVIGIVMLHRVHVPAVPDWVSVQIIPVGASRSGKALKPVKNIVIHYVGNPGTSAQQNHDYYDNPGTTVSSHFVVGLEGEIIQCIPLGEKSHASNHRNADTISVEVCHPDETGAFLPQTYDALVQLTAWLCNAYRLDAQDVIRHYDITGKQCPLYFVEHETAWNQFLDDVSAAMDT